MVAKYQYLARYHDLLARSSARITCYVYSSEFLKRCPILAYNLALKDNLIEDYESE